MIPKDMPENHGLSSQDLLAFFRKIESLDLAVNGFMLLQDGKATAEFWREPYRKDSEQVLFSLSKSFTSIAIGIAWDEGYLSLDDQVAAFFPDKRPDPVSPHLEKMTIHHLLSMNAGHQANIYEAVVKQQDWVKAFLSLEVEHEPGSYYQYSTPAAYMLSAILQRATGEGLVDFLMPRLFEPLGIPRPSWETCPLGIAAGGMGLSLSAEGVAKFGLMLLHKGSFEGRRIVSERYIELAVAEHSDNRKEGAPIDAAQGYGYQFHRCRRGCYRGDGAFGQLCFVAPQHNLVIAANCSFPSMRPLHTLLDLIYEHIIDQLDANASLPTVEGAEMSFRFKRQSAVLPAAVASENHPYWSRVSKSYRMADNPNGVEQMIISLNHDELELRLHYRDGREQSLPFHFSQPVEAETVFWKDLCLHMQKVVTYAAWRDNTTLQLTMYYIETPYVVDYTIRLDEVSIDVQFDINVSMNLSGYHMTGSLETGHQENLHLARRQ
ncbi:class A beta-lactamase-related serine hydrolase [Paenibacillus sp. 1011MAR3C5]|uniref:serine hydrolase domain-containing protein n=1 Tax=Paenibacillus sp. 1011MAR3C5 TaxID=1675787 RepID=UPI000E6B805D|nr:serine hydrolase domain-containing protein [Paenibacillus sp. 1011MAR3C5]RJE87484.1 class A beta-lactamase-related serine hydrolase [Paenibacillus sp. 1011MAR3C5]